MEKKKIIFYVGSLAKGGTERVVVNLAQYMWECGYEVLVATKEKADEEYPLPSGIKRILADITDEEQTSSRILNFTRRVKKLKNIWRTQQPDSIVSFIKKNNFMAILSSRGLHIPVFVSVRSAAFCEYSGCYRRIANLLFSRATGVIVQTQEAREYFCRKVQKKAVVLKNPLHPDFVREPVSFSRKDKIVTVGRLDANKNQEMLIKAFERIHDKYPQTQVVLYGDGEAKERLKALITDLNLDSQVFLAGRQSNIKEKIKDARVFVLTSKVEGVPNALMEAMAMGLAVISTDCAGGGARELIQNGVNGMLIPVDDIDALARTLDTVLQDSQLEQTLSHNALEIRKKMNPDAVNAAWKQYLDSYM